MRGKEGESINQIKRKKEEWNSQNAWVGKDGHQKGL